MKVLRYISLNNITDLMFFILLYPVGIMLRKKRDVWIVSEGMNGARDNGYFFFKYVREKHPEQEIYYIIDKNSSDYEKVRKVGKVIEYRSLMHFVYIWVSNKRISTALGAEYPNRIVGKLMEKVGLMTSKKVNLKHGIIKDEVKNHFYKKSNVDLLICGAKPEYEYVLQTFGYPKDNVKYTGFCRFDGLHEEKIGNKIILVMPTWRRWMRNYTEDEFKNSHFYKSYNSFLNNKELISFLEENDITLIFYPHIVLQKMVHIFKSISQNIIIANNKDYDVQTLLKASSLLITDYSSVFFDFAYMLKPMVFYQFDYEKYRESHYSSGYFDYKKSFGPISKDIITTINYIKSYHDREFTLEDIYERRVHEYFPVRDSKNCERVYTEICKL